MHSDTPPTPTSPEVRASSDDRPQRAGRDVRAPALFISVPSPLAVQDRGYADALRRFGVQLRPPKGILAVSSNWRTIRPVRVTGGRHPGIDHDYGDFPAWLEKLTYRCPGSPAIAADAARLISSAGMPALLDMQQALDFRVWMPLSLMYPSAKVPVVQVSLPAGTSPEDLLALGRAVAPLRRSGILVIGSGCSAWNPHRARYDTIDAAPEPWARAFDDWVGERLAALDIPALVDYRRQGPHAHLAAQAPEQLDPLFVVLGTLLPGDRAHHLYDGFHAGCLSMRTCALAGRRKDDLRLPDDLAGAG